MVTKPPPKDDPDTAAPAGIFDSALAGSVKESAQQIWLAGMGAFAKAQAEGGKVFESLVKEGTSLQRKTQQVAEEKIVEVQAKAGQQWGKLESLFEERTERALGRLGVPTAKDVEALAARVDALSAQVAQLAKAPTAKAATKKAPAKKTALKKTTSSRPKTRRATPPSS